MEPTRVGNQTKCQHRVPGLLTAAVSKGNVAEAMVDQGTDCLQVRRLLSSQV